MTYAGKLKDSRWLEKRKEVLELDGNRCRRCLTKQNLQVHHKVYISGAEPWQYPDEFLITLCADCHKKEEEYKIKTKGLLDELSAKGISYSAIFDYLSSLKTKVEYGS